MKWDSKLELSARARIESFFAVGSCEWGSDYKTHALSIRNAVMNRRGSLKNCQLFVLYGLRIVDLK